MDNQKLEKYRAKSDRQIFLSAAILPGIILLTTWILWLFSQFFGFDLIRFVKGRKEARDAISPQFYLVFAAAATVICAIWVWLNYLKQRHLIRHGILLEGTLTKIGIAASSMRNCSYEYEFNGRTYTQHLSLLEATAQEIGVGGRLSILVDPGRPQRSLPLSEL